MENRISVQRHRDPRNLQSTQARRVVAITKLQTCFFFQTVLETVSRNVIITNLLIGPLHRSLEEVFDGRMVLLEKIFYKFVWIYRLDHDRQIGTVQRGLGVDLGDIINDDSCVNVC